MKYYVITAIIALAAAKTRDKSENNLSKGTLKKVHVNKKQKRQAKGSSPASSRGAYPAASTT
jgi:hypothetical protein